MNTVEQNASEHLQALHTALVDAKQGYGKAIEEASDNPDLLAALRAVDALHSDAHRDVHGMLIGRGSEPDEDGSFMGSVHKAVVSVRSAVVGLDEGSLSSFASGEENNLELYDEAIRAERDEASRTLLASHRERLAAQIAQMKVLAGRQK